MKRNANGSMFHPIKGREHLVKCRNGEGQVKRVAYLRRVFHIVRRKETLGETNGLVLDEDWGILGMGGS